MPSTIKFRRIAPGYYVHRDQAGREWILQDFESYAPFRRWWGFFTHDAMGRQDGPHDAYDTKREAIAAFRYGYVEIVGL